LHFFHPEVFLKSSLKAFFKKEPRR